MKVYLIAKCAPYEGCYPEAVFSTEEAADAWANEQSYRSDYIIFEFTLDEPGFTRELILY